MSREPFDDDDPQIDWFDDDDEDDWDDDWNDDWDDDDDDTDDPDYPLNPQ